MVLNIYSFQHMLQNFDGYNRSKTGRIKKLSQQLRVCGHFRASSVMALCIC